MPKNGCLMLNNNYTIFPPHPIDRVGPFPSGYVPFPPNGSKEPLKEPSKELLKEPLVGDPAEGRSHNRRAAILFAAMFNSIWPIPFE